MISRLYPIDEAYKRSDQDGVGDEDFSQFKKSLEVSLKPGDPLQIKMQKNKQKRLLYIHLKRKEILNFTTAQSNFIDNCFKQLGLQRRSVLKSRRMSVSSV